MSGFVATAPATGVTEISSGDWYPSINLAAARAIMRADGTVTDDRLTECLSVAVSTVEDLLDAWQQQQLALGRLTLADVPSKQLNGESRLVLLYRRAVYASAQAELIERYRGVDATAAADRRADAMTTTIDDYQRYLRYAIRDILGRPRSDVELI
jgi:hypothetical protein